MGGWGSGSELRSSIATTAQAYKFDMSVLRETGLLDEFRRVLVQDPRAFVELELTAQREESYLLRPWIGTRTGNGPGLEPTEVSRVAWLAETSLFVTVVSSVPNYGGLRLWFLCPRSNCRRRCRILYRERHTNARAFTCVRCAGMAYQSQRETRVDRLANRANRLASRLLLESGTTNVYLKPRCMRWKTFASLAAEINRLDTIWQGIALRQLAPFVKAVNALEQRATRRSLQSRTGS